MENKEILGLAISERTKISKLMDSMQYVKPLLVFRGVLGKRIISISVRWDNPPPYDEDEMNTLVDLFEAEWAKSRDEVYAAVYN